MTTKSAPRIERTLGHNVGITVGKAIDAELDVVTGYKAARDPALVEARRVANEKTRIALTAELLAELK